MNNHPNPDQDDVDDRMFRLLGKDAESQRKRMLRWLLEEERFIRASEEYWSKRRSTRAARLQVEQLKAGKPEDASFHRWSQSHARDIQDFDYLLTHRDRLDEQIKEHMEIAAAKMTHVTQDGEKGYFQKLEANIGWKDYITPIIMSQPVVADKVVRCGLWSSAKNSRRCHKSDLCSFCLWNDILRALFETFGTASNSFTRSPNWMFITIGFTAQRKNSKAVGRDLERDDFHFVRGDHLYDPYPICLGGGDQVEDGEYVGYEDVQVLGRIIQDALDELYKSKVILGYRSKLEGAFMLIPGHSKRVNFHEHAVANGRDRNVQGIADMLHQSVKERLRRHRRHMNRLYYPNVLVLRIRTPEDLERCIIYSEKVVPIDKIVMDALNHPAARGVDGELDGDYVEKLKVNLREFIDNDLPMIFGSFVSDSGPGRISRRKAVGNMRFVDKGCIGDEPLWHVTWRHNRAEAQRKRRMKNQKGRKRGAKKISAAQKARIKKAQQKIISDPGHEF
jgi:hypothetical protein